jgi:hypothetical protein
VPACSSSRRPGSVSATLLVVRDSNVTPRRASSYRTDWLRAEEEIPGSDAVTAGFDRLAWAGASWPTP